MTSNISAKMSVNFTGQKQVITGDPTASSPAVQLFGTTGVINKAWSSTTSPAGTEELSGHVAMVSGTATVDLTAFTQSGLTPNVNATGLKLRAFIVVADAANVANISVATGGTNGYTALGTLSAISPGDFRMGSVSNPIAIDGTHKTIDITGTATDGVSIFFVFGP